MHETRIAILEDDKLVEIWVERPDNERMVGDIYKGTVNAVIPGIQAAFVDIGMEKSAFLHASDVSGDTIDFAAQYDIDEDEDEEEEEKDHQERNGQKRPKRQKGKRRTDRRDKKYPPIEGIIKQGQEIIVQITKEPISTKGARITTEITLAGRFLVLMPGGSKVGVSRKIESWAERRRLRQIMMKHKPKGFGVIIRTLAQEKGDNELVADLKDLLNKYEQLMKKMDTKKPPVQLHKEMGMTSGIIRDLLSEDVTSVLVDSQEHYNDIRTYLMSVSSNMVDKVKLYKEKEPIFDHYGIEKEIDNIFSRKVWLKKGGFLVFDHTEALTVVDVNSGRYVGKSNQEETIFNTNRESAIEIARQLRLRDIGGIVVIDFIDMLDVNDRTRIEDIFADALKNDRSRISISQISDFGLMEMTRQRVRPSLIYTFAEPCPTCNGIGMVQGRDTTVTKLERWLKRAENFGKEKAYTLFVHPSVYEFLIENEEERLGMLKSTTRLEIDIVVDDKIKIDEFHVFSTTRGVDVTGEYDKSNGTKQNKSSAEAPKPSKSFTRPDASDNDKFGRKPKARTRR